MKRFIIVSGLVSAFVVAPAQAQEGRFYVGGFVGDRFGSGQTFRGANLAGDPRVIRTPTKDAVTGGITLGAIVGEGHWGRLRVEGELAASRNKLNRLVLNNVERQLLEGRKSVTTQMVNLAYDTPKIANLVRFSVGGGIGNGNIDYDIRYNVTATGPTINIPTSASGHLAYQAIAGVTVSVVPHLELVADARYLRIGAHDVERFNQSAGTLDSVLDTHFHSTAATVGFRYIL
ncbi:outer membrane beta-barrel protein [Sphingomonas sp.]|uniref:outer membrane beta-barrel protein n=1 Tax=Sphingomonas sp. TaxID=28214 RepID=UPI003B3B1692